MGSDKRFTRRRSLRLRLLALLLVPLVFLAGLWAFAVYLTAHDALGRDDASAAHQEIAVPAGALVATLQQERLSAAAAVSAHSGQNRTGAGAGRAVTDAAQAAFRRSAGSPRARQAMSRLIGERLGDALRRLDGLPAVRARADAGTADALGTIGDYNAIIDSLDRLVGGLTVINDVGVYEQGVAINATSTAAELMTRENALVTSALATKGATLTAPEYAMFVRSANNGRYLYDTSVAALRSSVRDPLDRLAASSDFTTFHALEDTVITRGPGQSLAPQAQSWRTVVTPLTTSWPRATDQAEATLAAEAKPVGDRITFLLYAAGVLGLLAMVMSVAVVVFFGRSLARELTGLQRAALELAHHRLPKVIRRLRGGETVDVDAEAPSLNVGRSTEIAKVADALTALQRTAVEAAVGEARLRRGINQVFLNLAWRSQSLLHRQLSMLDTMERQASDPDALEDLFALDHLTTRMRRHAEGLVILSGAPPARGWHHPVAVRDILRGALAEVEDYTRVVVETVSPVALEGGAVADITHLVAELIENATAFSPPGTQVRLRAQPVAGGYTVEVEDRGIGMDEAELAAANERLAHPPEFDLADSDRLGLFIIGRLAMRHHITVTLGTSPYGGVRAVVLIPPDVIARDDGPVYEQTWADEPAADSGWRPGTGWASPAAPVPRPAVTPREIVPPPERGGRTGAALPELPRRVRQANLAPQLRRDAPPPETMRTDPATTRPPEEVRSLMSSLQQGWLRGRQDEDLDE